MSNEFSLPETMKALVIRSPSDGPNIETVPTPKAARGAAVVRVLSATVLHFVRDMYLGKRPISLPMPLTIGTSAIGRIVEPGPDATKLKWGDVVFIDMILRSRDNQSDACLAGVNDGFSSGSKKLMAEGYRDWTYAEYCLAPLENLTLLNADRLLGEPSSGGLGYKIEELNFITTALVPFSGLRDNGLKPGQTVIIAPANGPFGGAEVIAMGRDTSKLAELRRNVPYAERLQTVPITGDMQADANELKKAGKIDVYLDIGPMQAHNSTQIKSFSFMGGYREDFAIPHGLIVAKNISLHGRYMYEPKAVVELIDMVQNGILKLGNPSGTEIVGSYPLDKWHEAWDAAVENAGVGKTVVVKP
ncbi:hypothetical protein M409DRAFT_71355 [Zasmidium cellare ATCC 36951]|uniref:Alcohol dehydrogenase-like N-terminal domain-containing protein n=1 Tax=Zasmidium cellare ATCC 36951 TaxID=1080233 RepID=A0A6A6BW44_ZASCE|nr:uncharacterized protein M409DRAFT_71355 [Zasmidium cellare ATCC 36951]KAF2159017.1 hypothetical protein M409DRAFT_71355 [Zasmidium cellare ATCC 36951]